MGLNFDHPSRKSLQGSRCFGCSLQKDTGQIQTGLSSESQGRWTLLLGLGPFVAQFLISGALILFIYPYICAHLFMPSCRTRFQNRSGQSGLAKLIAAPDWLRNSLGGRNKNSYSRVLLEWVLNSSKRISQFNSSTISWFTYLARFQNIIPSRNETESWLWL